MRRRHRRVAIDDGPHEGSGEIRPPEISCEKEPLESLWCDTAVDSNPCMMIDLSIGGGMKERERERCGVSDQEWITLPKSLLEVSCFVVLCREGADG